MKMRTPPPRKSRFHSIISNLSPRLEVHGWTAQFRCTSLLDHSISERDTLNRGATCRIFEVWLALRNPWALDHWSFWYFVQECYFLFYDCCWWCTKLTWRSCEDTCIQYNSRLKIVWIHWHLVGLSARRLNHVNPNKDISYQDTFNEDISHQDTFISCWHNNGQNFFN